MILTLTIFISPSENSLKSLILSTRQGHWYYSFIQLWHIKVYGWAYFDTNLFVN